MSLVSDPVLTFLCIPPLEIQALLLSDCLVLLQRGPDDRLQLRYPSRWLGGGSGDSKTSFSPLVKLDSLLVRSVATGTPAVSLVLTSFVCFLGRVFYSLLGDNVWHHFVFFLVSLIKYPNVVVSPQTTKPCTSSAPWRGRSTSWWLGHYQRRTRKLFHRRNNCSALLYIWKMCWLCISFLQMERFSWKGHCISWGFVTTDQSWIYAHIVSKSDVS